MTHKNIHEDIMKTIRDRNITMRPKIYFTARALLLMVVAVCIFLISTALCTFIFFSIRINHHDTLLGFGPRGFVFFLSIFPWTYLAIDLALLLVLNRLLREFKVGYRSPWLIGAIIMFAAIAALGFVIDHETGVNDSMLTHDVHHELPLPFAGWFLSARVRPPHDTGMCRCVITSIGTSSITAVREDEGASSTLQIIIPKNEDNATSSNLHVGDTIMVIGSMNRGTIHAFGIRVINDTEGTKADQAQ